MTALKTGALKTGKLKTGGLKDTGYESQLGELTKTMAGTPRRRVEVGFKNLPPEGVRIVPIRKAKRKQPKENQDDELDDDLHVVSAAAAAGVWTLPADASERRLFSVTVSGWAFGLAGSHFFTIEILDATGNVLALGAVPGDGGVVPDGHVCFALGLITFQTINLASMVWSCGALPDLPIPPNGTARLTLQQHAATDTTPAAFFSFRYS